MLTDHINLTGSLVVTGLGCADLGDFGSAQRVGHRHRQRRTGYLGADRKASHLFPLGKGTRRLPLTPCTAIAVDGRRSVAERPHTVTMDNFLSAEGSPSRLDELPDGLRRGYGAQ